MKVLGLCDEVARVARFARTLDGVDVNFHALVCNNRRLATLRFWAGVVAQFLAMPGRDRWAALEMLARRRLRISRHALHDAPTVARIRAAAFDVGLHAAGVIYRKPLLDAFRRGILNAHIGLLPAYRGRSVMEWSLLYGDPTGITVFFMDEGIDTGPELVLRETVSVAAEGSTDDAKAHLFSLDAAMYRKALERLLSPDYDPLHQAPEDGTRYYVMSGLLCQVVEQAISP